MNSNDLRKILGGANDTYATAMGIPSPPRYEPKVWTDGRWGVFDSFAQTFAEGELYESKASASIAATRLNGAYVRTRAA